VGCGWRRRAGGIFGENFVQRANGRVHVISMQNIWRQKAQDSVAGAVDDDAPLEHFGDN
jgi:hypothetical protein